MQIDLTKLNSKIVDYIEFKNEVIIDEVNLKKAGILSVDEIIADGFVKKMTDDYNLEFKITGNIYLPCSITLKPVKFPLDIEISMNLSEIDENFAENVKINENTIDIFPIIWENILVEIPMKVVSADATYTNLKGEGWELVTEERKKTGANPELAKLKDLL